MESWDVEGSSVRREWAYEGDLTPQRGSETLKTVRRTREGPRGARGGLS